MADKTIPLEIKCRDCGAEPYQKCSDDVIGVYEYTFHNLRIADAEKPAELNEIKPGHPIWDEVWERGSPDNPTHANHLTQLFEAKLQVAALQQEVERLKAQIPNERLLSRLLGLEDGMSMSDSIEAENATLRAQVERLKQSGRSEPLDFAKVPFDVLCEVHSELFNYARDLEAQLERQQRAATDEDESFRLLKHYRGSYWHKRCTIGSESPYFDHRCIICKRTDELIASRTLAPSQDEKE